MTKPRRKPYYSFSSFLSYFARHKLKLAIVMTSFALADVLLAIIPVFIGKLIAALTANPVRGHTAVIYVWLLIGCSTGHNLLWRLSEFLYMKLLQPLSYRYEKILFAKVIGMPYPYFVDKFTGKVSSYINTIRQEQHEFIENLCQNYVNQAVSLVAIIIILGAINWQTGLIFIIGLAGMFVAGRHTIHTSAHYEKIAADRQATKNGKIIDTIANFVNVKSFRKEIREIQTVANEETQTIRAAAASYKWGIVFWGTMSFFIRDFIWPAAIGLNVYLYLHHELSIGQLATLLSTILIFSSTIWELIWYISQLNLKLARVEEAHQYLFGDHKLQLDDASERQPMTHQLEQQFELRNLSFAYPDKSDTKVLKAINLTLQKGEKLGVVGRSGSGKTTITKLLLGYYPTETGSLVLDNTAIKSRELAQLISYVPQDTSLFHRTIAENIAYASDNSVSHDDIVAAAKRAHAHEFITQIGDGYDALVGERGVKLSAGQRQRIAIARAFLDDKPILILDEATSALDSESEVLVQQALEALWSDKTVIAIAHRLSTLRNMDRIIVLDKGTIIEQGSHEELLAQNGQYAEFWNHQSGGFIDE